MERVRSSVVVCPGGAAGERAILNSAICGVGMDRRKRHRNNEGHVSIDRRKRHRKGNKKEGRTNKPNKKPKGSDEAVEDMPSASKEKGDGQRRKTNMVTLRSPPNVQESLVIEIMRYMVYEPECTPLELGLFDVDGNLKEAAAFLLEGMKFHADVYRQYRINGYADLQLEVADDDDDDKELTHELAVEVNEEDMEDKMRPKEEEEEEEMPLARNAGSMEEGAGKTKLVTWDLSKELIDYLLTKEIMGFLATDTPCPLWPNMTGELFATQLKEEVVAQFKENREFEAYVLYQYRTTGYVEILRMMRRRTRRRRCRIIICLIVFAGSRDQGWLLPGN